MQFKSLCAVSYSPSMAVSLAVYEIFSVKEWCDLVNRVRVSWKWHHLIDHLYEFIFAFHSNYGDIFYRLRYIATYW